ncbi:hypothetical protein LCGC14_2799210 [marine sediment metagenome]|uniref:Uncharacterized protein n=1 Tax=marine sediment metagenome TaxID=412755 RepID=A0A0F8YNC9_9ZZZZ
MRRRFGMRLRTMRVVAGITDVMGSISDSLAISKCDRLSRAFRRAYNACDDLHWAMGSPIRRTMVKQDTEDDNGR